MIYATHALAAPVMMATASDMLWDCGVITAARRPQPLNVNPVGHLKDVRHVVADQDDR